MKMKIFNGGKDEKVVLKNTFMLYLMTIAKYVFPLLLFPYLTRVLGVEKYGVVTYMTAVASYVSLAIDFGFNFSATRKISKCRDDKQAVAKVFASVVQAKVILGLLSGVGVALLVPFVHILRENFVVLVAYYFSTLLLAFLPDFIYRGTEQMQGMTMRYVLSKAVTTGLTLLLVKGPEHLLLVPIFNGVGNLVSVVFTWSHLKKLIGITFHFEPLRYSFSEIRESCVFFISTFASTAFTLANTALMGIVSLQEADIACWGVAFQLVSIVISLYEPITTSIYPRMVSSKNLKLVRTALFLAIPVILVGIAFCYFMAPILVNIVAGEGYDAAIKIFRIMLPVLLFTYPAQLLGFPVLSAVNKEKYATISTVVSAIFHVVGLILLIAFQAFTLVSVAILRSMTEFVFMNLRVYFYMKVRKCFAERPDDSE